MNWITLPLALATALVVEQAAAKSRLTDPVKIARECKSEAEQFCKGVRPGGTRIMVCLKKNISDLSPACLAALRSAE